jgi:hypothetical protein
MLSGAVRRSQRVVQDAGASTENVVSCFFRRQEAHIQDLDKLIETA